MNDVFFKYPFTKDKKQIQFELHAETFITSRKPILGFNEIQKFEGQELPNLFPVNQTISIQRENVYDLENIYRKY